MSEEDRISLTLKEVLVIKEWFRFVTMYSQVEERDRELVKKLAKFEATFYDVVVNSEEVNEDERE